MEEDAARRLAVLGRAPELVGVDPWFNAPDGEPLRLPALRDRVALLKFRTFACLNCQRTLTFLRRMHDQHLPDFTVVGVHSREFTFERSVQNVERMHYPYGRAAAVQVRGTRRKQASLANDSSSGWVASLGAPQIVRSL
jgi:hypothetical protein